MIWSPNIGDHPCLVSDLITTKSSVSSSAFFSDLITTNWNYQRNVSSPKSDNHHTIVVVCISPPDLPTDVLMILIISPPGLASSSTALPQTGGQARMGNRYLHSLCCSLYLDIFCSILASQYHQSMFLSSQASSIF